MDEIIAAAEGAAEAVRALQDEIDALHGRTVNVGIDAATTQAAAAAAAINDLTQAQDHEATAADASAVAAAAAAAAVNEMAAAEERAAVAADDVAARVAAAAAVIARFDEYQKGVVASSVEASVAMDQQGAAARILAYSDYQAAAASMEATKAAIEQAAAESSVADAVAAARDQILGYTAANYLAAAAQTKVAIEGAGVWSVVAAGEEKATAGATAAGGAFRGVWGILAAINAMQIPLFGGAGFFGIMKTVTGMHLLVDVVAELAAVLIPAGIALAAFGAAALPTVQAITHQMQNMYTVTTATGQALYPLSGGFQRVAAAVQPEVLVLFGEALRTINSRMGTFQTLATQTGTILDQLGARASAALLSSGMSQFLHNAAADVQMLGTLFGNVFGIIGNILHVLPGYAQPLLAALVGITHALEAITASGAVQWLLGLGLAFHGAILWAGLLATAVLKLGPALWAWIEPAITRLVALGVAFSAVAAEEGVFAAASAALEAVNPLVWVAAAIALIGGLIYAFATARTSTQQWASSLLQGVQNASAGIGGLSALENAQIQVAGRLAAAQDTLAAASSRMSHAAVMAAGSWREPFATNVGQARQSIATLTGTQQILADQTQLYNYRVGVLAKSLGGTSTAMGMLAASGVKMNQMLTYGKNALAQVEAQVLGTAAAYRAMGQTGGMLGADMNAMNVLASDQYNAVTKLNQAWQSWMQVVTGGMSSLAQFETALTGMKNDSASASASLTGSISSINSATGGLTYTLKGFGPAAMQSWQQFTAAVGQGNTVIAQMRTYMALGAVTGGQFQGTIKALVAQMIPFAQGNKAALTMLDNLAIQAGGPTTNSLAKLQQWAGSSAGAATRLAKGLEAATIAGGNLSADALHVANVLSTTLDSAMIKTVSQTSGYNTALAKLQRDIQSGHASRHQLWQDQMNVAASARLASGEYAKWTTQQSKADLAVAKSAQSMAQAHAELMKLPPAALAAARGTLAHAQAIDRTSAAMMGANPRLQTNGSNTKTQGQNAQTAAQHINTLAQQILTAGGNALTAAGKMITLASGEAKAGQAAATAATQVHALASAIAGLQNKTVTVTYRQIGGPGVGGSPIIGPGSAGLAGHAMGTSYAAAGMAMVGEYGPELMMFGGGEQVFSASQTAAILAMSRQPTVHPAALMGTPAPAGGGGTPVVIHNVLKLDGSVIYDKMQPYSFQYSKRNSGATTGLNIPGNRIG